MEGDKEVSGVPKNGYLVFLSWIGLSLVVTLYSKWLMNLYFPYPVSMSFVHMLVASVLSHVMAIFSARKEGRSTSNILSIKELTSSERNKILMFSLLVAVNIWVSNASLFMVSISLHQMARATIPLFTMALGILFFKHSYKLSQIPPVFLVTLGVAITVNNSPEWSIYGLFIVFFGCCISSLKGIAAQKMQVESLNIGPISMLQYVAPVASLVLGVISFSFGEFKEIGIQSKNMDRVLVLLTLLLLVFAGVLAFILNVLSFKSSSIVTPLAMNIAGNMKQLLTCLFGCFIFGEHITKKLLIGIVLTTIGAFWYSIDKRKEDKRRKVKYVKGRYIDRVGLGIPQDMERTVNPVRFESKITFSELAKVRKSDIVLEESREAQVIQKEGINTNTKSLELIEAKKEFNDTEIDFGDDSVLMSLEISLDGDSESKPFSTEEKEEEQGTFVDLEEKGRINGKLEMEEGPYSLESEAGIKVMVIANENLDSSNRDL